MAAFTKTTRSTGVGVKQPLSNNFVNRSLQEGIPTQADSMSMGGIGRAGPAYHQSLGVDESAIGGQTIQTTN